MTPFYVHNGTHVIRCGYAPSDYILIQAGEGEYVVEGPTPWVTPQPGETYQWNLVTETWDDSRPVDIIKESVKQSIDTVRSQRNYAPVVFNNTLFDADSVAQGNIASWMVNIANGVAVPVGFVWRDFYNNDHPATAEFIVGLGRSVTERGTRLYQLAWAKKAEVDTLVSKEDIASYDIASGWDSV